LIRPAQTANPYQIARNKKGSLLAPFTAELPLSAVPTTATDGIFGGS